MKHTYFLLIGSLLLAGTAHAQATFSIGPRVGGNLSSAHFSTKGQTSYVSSAYTNRQGFEAGLTSTVQLGHLAVQPSLLFSQKGYRGSGYSLSFDMLSSYEQDVRLNYLTLPLNLAFTLGHDGQGLQILAGPYASLLVGGNYAQQVSGFEETTGKIKAASIVSDPRFNKQYAQRFDAGLQAGVGYRLKALQLQATYSLGLRNVAVPYRGYDGKLYYYTQDYYNRAFQVSLSYLVSARG